MGTITFSRLRDSEDWGLRGAKDTPEDQPPEEGGMVTVTKKSGEQQEGADAFLEKRAPNFEDAS